jgi:hypothetical protein
MIRNRIEDAGPDAVLLTESSGESIAVVGDADRVLVVHMDGAIGHCGRLHALEVTGQERRVLLTLPRPLADLGELYAADRCVDVRHSTVEADNLVLVLPLHALVAVEAHHPLQLGSGDRHHPALTRCHVLGGVEREHRKRAE